LSYFVLICARGGSKGIPKKNIRSFLGKPLIAWSIEIAKKLPGNPRVIVSTDDEEIAQIARQFGAEIPFIRPIYLAQDNSPEWDVWKHAINFLNLEDSQKYKEILVLPPTAPLRNISDIVGLIDHFNESNVDIVLTVSEASRNPFFNMVKENSKGLVELVCRDSKHIFRRQDAPEVFDITTIAYMAKTEFILNSSSIFDGTVSKVIVPKVRSIDIDDIIDFEVAEFLMKKIER